MAVSIIYILLIFFLIHKLNFFQIERIKKSEIILAFGFKLIAAYILYLIYTKYYRERHLADIFKFYDDSKIISDTFLANPIDFFQMILGLDFNQEYFEINYYINMNHWDTSYESVLMNESRLIIKINAILNIIGFGNYSFNVISFVFISYMGILMIIKSLLNYIKLQKTNILFWSVTLFPSILLWTSGILKEPLSFLGIGLFLYGIKEQNNQLKFSLKYFSYTTIGTLLLFTIKFYVFACFLPPVIILFIINKWNLNPIKTILSSIVILLTSIIILSLISSDLNPIKILSTKQNDFLALAEFYKSGSYISSKPIDNNIFSFLKALPIGFVNGFLRPFPNDINKLIHLLPFIENIILYTLFIFIFIKSKKTFKNMKGIGKNILLCSLLFTILLFTLTGMSAPVIGALVRYKIPGTFFLISSLAIIYDINEKQKNH